MPRHTRSPRHRAFTLIELLIVITIIGVLAALGTWAGWRALLAVRQATIAMDINGLESAVNEYKGKYTDVPPECANNNTAGSLLNNRIHAHFRKAYPRHTETNLTINNLCAALDQAEALVYFLGGNPDNAYNPRDNQQYPISGAGQPKKFYNFAAARLVDTDGDGYHTFVQPHGANVPYVYFDSATYGQSYFGNATVGYAVPYGTDTPTAASAWEAPDTFQIIGAGLDSHFGDWGGGAPTLALIKFFPSGVGGAAPRTAYSRQDLDNVTSFAEGTLESRKP